MHRHFMPWTNRNALRDPHIPLDAKHKFTVTCPPAVFMETVEGSPEHEK
jgi:hypothetical protein